jgi:hypothetical protein
MPREKYNPATVIWNAKNYRLHIDFSRDNMCNTCNGIRQAISYNSNSLSFTMWMSVFASKKICGIAYWLDNFFAHSYFLAIFYKFKYGGDFLSVILSKWELFQTYSFIYNVVSVVMFALVHN